MFLPQFHCELNLIEQCWGYPKSLDWLSPPSSMEADLEKNTVKFLNAIPLVTIQQFSLRVNFSHPFNNLNFKF